MSDEIMEIEKSFAELLEESIKTLNTGDKVTGTVVDITPTEVQVELGIKYPGYIPLSELSDDPTVKPEDVVKVGDEVKAKIIGTEKGKISLSMKALLTKEEVPEREHVFNYKEEGRASTNLGDLLKNIKL